ncbi:hypothetical protein T265_02305 [Opisthorchis viverrini]|uniref:Uncharacterized protein n=1 Tax=Opisthorchis viverrini TaxID=6198 RepID=A0A075AIF4_OPIVI|nr:hypothetical protein T265_02305 [Opisthorchis viverrini]KER31539.1 hypothetical protein T265_02305 [Opisthorchis viverrini]
MPHRFPHVAVGYNGIRRPNVHFQLPLLPPESSLKISERIRPETYCTNKSQPKKPNQETNNEDIHIMWVRGSNAPDSTPDDYGVMNAHSA